MEKLDFKNSFAKKNSEKITECAANLADNETPITPDDFEILRNLIDALEKGELTQELIDKFNNVPNHGACWKRINDTLKCAYWNGKFNQK